jgi:hypothetical protein
MEGEGKGRGGREGGREGGRGGDRGEGGEGSEPEPQVSRQITALDHIHTHTYFITANEHVKKIF